MATGCETVLETEQATENQQATKDEQPCLNCVSCYDHRDDCTPIDMPCGIHFYCSSCFRRGLEVSLVNESRYPLRCANIACAKISSEHVENALADDQPAEKSLLDRYLEKAEEFSVDANLRRYCTNQECITTQGKPRFLNIDILGHNGRVICPDCDAITCIHCQTRIHVGGEHFCITDEHDEGVRDYIATLPEDERWKRQRCCGCLAWVEKAEACNHMTCSCGAQFCLICGRAWEGISLCVHGCPVDGPAVYDADGYNQDGYHRETGLDRAGALRTNDAQPGDDQGGWGNVGNDDDGGEQDWRVFGHIYGDDGFNRWGNDREGYGRDGFSMYQPNTEQKTLLTNMGD